MNIETPKSITNEMRNSQDRWNRYHGYGADCDVIDTDAMLKSYADRIDSSVGGLVEQIHAAENVLHKLDEVIKWLDVHGGSDWIAIDLCQRSRERILELLNEYWKKYPHERKDSND